jgi:hypothetical protein
MRISQHVGLYRKASWSRSWHIATQFVILHATQIFCLQLGGAVRSSMRKHSFAPLFQSFIHVRSMIFQISTSGVTLNRWVAYFSCSSVVIKYTECFKKSFTMVFQMLLCGECYTERWRCWTIDSLYASKCKCFRNIHHTVTFGIPS